MSHQAKVNHLAGSFRSGVARSREMSPKVVRGFTDYGVFCGCDLVGRPRGRRYQRWLRAGYIRSVIRCYRSPLRATRLPRSQHATLLEAKGRR
jgi:hypothetical protein